MFSLQRDNSGSQKVKRSRGSTGGGGGGGGFRGFKPPLGLPSKNLMCIEKRHHNMSRPTLCSYSTLSQAQPQTIGFKPPPPLGCQVNMWRYHGLLFMVSIALVDARKTSLTGVQNSPKKSARSIKIAPKKSARRYAARGRCSALSLGQTPPPLGKKLDPPLKRNSCFSQRDLPI